jgi:hypothetical protein
MKKANALPRQTLFEVDQSDLIREALPTRNWQAVVQCDKQFDPN